MNVLVPQEANGVLPQPTSVVTTRPGNIVILMILILGHHHHPQDQVEAVLDQILIQIQIQTLDILRLFQGRIVLFHSNTRENCTIVVPQKILEAFLGVQHLLTLTTVLQTGTIVNHPVLGPQHHLQDQDHHPHHQDLHHQDQAHLIVHQALMKRM